ncbi:hypothetical protein LCGC14_0548010 [marine sediment metagenome]|uniref:Uncharacterized protein n=1 Tax=marine sediment metagenome TaxID=412755 RepID=A0A0F9RVP7_9ZZZZ
MTLTKDEIMKFLQEHIQGCCGHSFTIEEMEERIAWNKEYQLKIARLNKEHDE